jgi:tetratricopeptide (TPR) repeat protein
MNLVYVLEIAGRAAEADSVYDANSRRGRPFGRTVEHRALHLIRLGEYAVADRVILAWLGESDPREQVDALWDLVISYREQGRFTEALDAARRMRPLLRRPGMTPPGLASFSVVEAQMLLEMGRPKDAAVLFDSLARQRSQTDAPSQRARAIAWMLAQTLGARFEAGDTVTMARLIDSLRTLGEQSGFGRDRRLHHYARGLLLSARGDDAGAIDELRASIFSPTTGYTRTNYQLARVYLRARRPREAVAVLQPALRGSLDASNLYVNRVELHELLARAWKEAGGRDSAAAHYAVVAKAWANADSAFARRRDALREFVR